MSSCRITESRERRYFRNGNWLKEMFIPRNMRGDIVLLNVYCSAAMMEVCSGQKNLRFNVFSGCKLFSSTQGSDPRLFFCAAFISYYEESDRGQTITTKKKQLNR